MIDDSTAYSQISRSLRKVQFEVRKGNSLREVLESLSIPESDFNSWVERYGADPAMLLHLEELPLIDAVCPLFLSRRNSEAMEQIGSAVCLMIGCEIFMLTAAHVYDNRENGILCIPEADAIRPVQGHWAYIPKPIGASRDCDKADMAYCGLSENQRENLHASIRPAQIGDLLMEDHHEVGDLFTFVGYPWRKTKDLPGVQQTQLCSYTGHAVSRAEYEALGYSYWANIVVKIRRKRTYSSLYQSFKTAAHPEGVSGGAVLAWPKMLSERISRPQLKLAGIAHSYHGDVHCMASTRIISYVLAILQNNPHLEQFFRIDRDT